MARRCDGAPKFALHVGPGYSGNSVTEAGYIRVRAWLHRLAPYAMPCAYIAFTLIVFWRLWTPIDGSIASWRFDPRFEYWGDLIFQCDTLGDGHLALWNPHDRAGFPVYGDPQPGMLYPLNWLFAVGGALGGGVPYVAITIKILMHWAFGAIGMHLFVRRLTGSEPASYVSGILFGWTAPKIRYAGSALNWSLAWIPWVLLALWWFAEKPGWRRGAVLGTTVAMLLLAGAPAVVLYMLIIAVPFGLYAMHGKLRASWKYLAAAAGVSLLWLLPLIASNMQQLPESVREDRNLAFITESVFTPAHFLSFVVPRFEGEPVYYGLFSILCMGVLVASAGRKRALIFLGIAAFGVALALGQHAGVLPSAASLASPFGMFRRAHRYLYVTSTAAAVLAGLGFAYVATLADPQRQKELGRRVLWVGGLVTFAIGLAYLVSYIDSDKTDSPKNIQFGLAFVSCAVGTWLLRAIAINTGTVRGIYAWIAVAIVALDIWTASAKVVDKGFTPPPRPKHDAHVELLDGVQTLWRVYDRGYLDFRAGTRLGIRDFGGYEDDPLGLARYKKLLAASQSHLPLLGHANVRYYLDGGRSPPLKPKKDDGFVPVTRTVDGTSKPMANMWELPDVAPAVMYVPAAVHASDVDDALEKLRAITPGRGAVVEGTKPPQAPADTPIAAGRITVLEPNRVVAEIDAPGPGLIVIAEAYFPAWTATINGHSAPIQPANVLFRGIAIDQAGHYEIEMRLRPMRLWLLLPAYAGGMGVFMWALVFPMWRRRRERAKT